MGSVIRFSGVALLAVAMGTAGCSTVPGTGRQRLDLMPDAQMNQLGREGFDQILSEQVVVSDGADVQRVQRIGRDVITSARSLYPSASIPDEWEIVLIEDDTPNAFAVPGGRIGVHTGMLRVAENDDALAAVLGHEVGHVLAEHSGERMSQVLLLGVGFAVGDAATRDEDEDTRRNVMLAIGIGSQVGIMLPYSRLHESEADELGLMISANAGYDPRESIGLWQRMNEEGGGRLEFLSTHPNPATRIDSLRALMPQARRLYLRAQAGQSR